jgi:hypothetical protein
MREWGTIEDVGEKCCSLLICLAKGSMVMSESNRGPLGTKKEFKNCSSNGLTLAAPSLGRGGGAALESLFGKGGGFATAPTNRCKPVGIGNETVYCGSVCRGRSNQSILGVNSPGLLLLRSGNFKKRIKQDSCTASRPVTGRSFQHEGNARFAQEGQSLLNHFTWTCGGVKEGERIGLVLLDCI